MHSILLPVFTALILAEVRSLLEERFSAVRRLSAQQYMEDYRLLTPEHGPPLALSWQSTVRPLFKWDYSPPETRKLESSTSETVPVETSSYFGNRHQSNKKIHPVSLSHDNKNIDHQRSGKHKPSSGRLKDGGEIRIKPKKKKVKKHKKISLKEAMLLRNCTEIIENEANKKLCEVQRKQIKKLRAQRRKKRRHMKKVRMERERKKQKQKRKMDHKFFAANDGEKLFSSEHTNNSSHNSSLVTGTSNSSVKNSDMSSVIEIPERKPEVNSTTARYDVNMSTTTNEIYDHEQSNVEVTDRRQDVSGSGSMGGSSLVTEGYMRVHGMQVGQELATEGMATWSTGDVRIQQQSSEAPTLLASRDKVRASGSLPGYVKADMSCVVGRFLPAPIVKHADVTYLRSGEVVDQVLVARYECQLGYRLEHVAQYRLVCSQRSWEGKLPHCVSSGEQPAELDPTKHCAECEQLCYARPGLQPFCSCYRGFQQYGDICLDINECLLRNGHGPCQDTCTNLHGGYTCSCNGIPGTRLSADNHTCEDVDECAAGTAGCSHRCLNTLGRVFCLCPPGLELGPDWKTCQDIDECLDEQLQTEVCDRDTECINTVGSYRCQRSGIHQVDQCSGSALCRLQDSNTTEAVQAAPVKCAGGLRVAADLSCEDVDECAVKNGGCEHQCVNTRGSFHCRCKPGFALDIDTRSCIEAALAAVCPPLDTPQHGYLQCERQLITVTRSRYGTRRRVVNHAGTVCRLRCPLGSGLRGAYRRTCSTTGYWAGPHDGVCLRFMVPTIKCPENITAELPPGQKTTHVMFEQPYTSVDWFRHVVSEPMWGKRLEGDLPAGLWSLRFTARHPVSDLSASCTFFIEVTR